MVRQYKGLVDHLGSFACSSTQSSTHSTKRPPCPRIYHPHSSTPEPSCAPAPFLLTKGRKSRRHRNPARRKGAGGIPPSIIHHNRPSRTISFCLFSPCPAASVSSSSPLGHGFRLTMIMVAMGNSRPAPWHDPPPTQPSLPTRRAHPLGAAGTRIEVHGTGVVIALPHPGGDGLRGLGGALMETIRTVPFLPCLAYHDHCRCGSFGGPCGRAQRVAV